MILDLKGIYKDYQQGKMTVPVLKEVDFSMEEGEYVAIMGPSGSGKTTLMNIIGCLDKPTKGTFLLNGEDRICISELSSPSKAERADKCGTAAELCKGSQKGAPGTCTKSSGACRPCRQGGF